MIVSQFQSWAETVPPPQRADGVSALARALLYSDLGPAESRAAVIALTGFLDDPSALVRRALADAFASAIDAPRAIVLALAEDEPEIASIVLSRSPLLADAELVDCAATVASEAQAAIASRPGLSAAVAAALAEVGSLEALLVLAANDEAPLPGFALLRMLERHGREASLRTALMARAPLPIVCRFELAAAAARDLAASARGAPARGCHERDHREAAERAAIEVACGAGAGPEGVTFEDLCILAQYLRQSGRLTAAFAFRTLLSAHRDLFVAVLSELSGMPAGRVEGFVKACRSAGFSALCRKAGFPASLLRPMRLALLALGDWEDRPGTGLSLPLVTGLYERCLALGEEPFDTLLVMLRRFELEATRLEARVQKQGLAGRTAFPAAAPADAVALVPDDFWAGVFEEADHLSLETGPDAFEGEMSAREAAWPGGGLIGTQESLLAPAMDREEPQIDGAPLDFEHPAGAFVRSDEPVVSVTHTVQETHVVQQNAGASIASPDQDAGALDDAAPEHDTVASAGAAADHDAAVSDHAVPDHATAASADAAPPLERHVLTYAETLELMQSRVDHESGAEEPSVPWFSHAKGRQRPSLYNPCANVEADLSRFEAELFAA